VYLSSSSESEDDEDKELIQARERVLASKGLFPLSDYEYKPGNCLFQSAVELASAQELDVPGLRRPDPAQALRQKLIAYLKTTAAHPEELQAYFKVGDGRRTETPEGGVNAVLRRLKKPAGDPSRCGWPTVEAVQALAFCLDVNIIVHCAMHPDLSREQWYGSRDGKARPQLHLLWSKVKDVDPEMRAPGQAACEAWGHYVPCLQTEGFKPSEPEPVFNWYDPIELSSSST